MKNRTRVKVLMCNKRASPFLLCITTMIVATAMMTATPRLAPTPMTVTKLSSCRPLKTVGIK